ncbi:hypothetical protein EIP86_010816 [Pleurotus ostreatoroseus]|nr:hypothetical protein EIP86_010816 [Pleurotus ostreatoroseus]
MALPVVNINVNYDSEKGESPVTVNLPLLSRSLERIGDFLSTFVAKDIEQDLADLDLEDEPTHNRYKGLKYMTQMQQIANREQQMLVIDLEDIHEFEKTVSELVSRIRNNARRYVQLFSEVVDSLMPQPTKDISEHDEVIDVILHQRRERNERVEGVSDGFPDHLLRR